MPIKLAETERFELSVRFTPYDGLANRWFQPLTHVSGALGKAAYSGANCVLQGLLMRVLINRIFAKRLPTLSPCPKKDSSHRRFIDLALSEPLNSSSFYNLTGSTSMAKQMRMARKILALVAGLMLLTPASAQITPIDPNDAINAPSTRAPQSAPPVEKATVINDGVPTDGAVQEAQATSDTTQAAPASGSATFQKDDLLGAAEGVFGKGAKGLAGIIENILKKQGEPSAYIVGREGGGAFIVGLRYGSGTLYHRIEGEKPAYWTGPSIGFDAGANAGSTFVLVYNLYDSEDLYKRFPSAEGVAYLVGGFNASYLRRGDVVLIPIRVGAGLRLGANVGYMKFSKKQRWLPF
jgi:hypothetical protein